MCGLVPHFPYCFENMFCKFIRKRSERYKSAPHVRCTSMARLLEVVELQGKLIDGEITQDKYDELLAAQFGQSPDPSQYQFTKKDDVKMDAPSAMKVLNRLEMGISSVDSDHSESYAKRMGFVVPDKSE